MPANVCDYCGAKNVSVWKKFGKRHCTKCWAKRQESEVNFLRDHIIVCQIKE